MHRHIKTGDRGKTFINGGFVEGAIIELMGDDLMAFRADMGDSYSIWRHDFVPDYKTELSQATDVSSPFSEDGVNADGRTNWIRDNAYFRWLNVGCPHGQDVSLWCEAEHAFDELG